MPRCSRTLFCSCLGVGQGCCLGIFHTRKEDGTAPEDANGTGTKRWDWRDFKCAYPSQKKKKKINFKKSHLPGCEDYWRGSCVQCSWSWAARGKTGAALSMLRPDPCWHPRGGLGMGFVQRMALFQGTECPGLGSASPVLLFILIPWGQSCVGGFVSLLWVLGA